MKDFNLPQVNSVAPMSLASQNDFVAHQKTTYPFSNTAPIPVFHKIVLSASDAVSGDVNTANFYVTLPNPLPHNAVLCVKDFIPFYDPATVDSAKNYVVRLPQLLAKNSYQSDDNAGTDVLFVGKNEYYNPVYAGSAGVPITDNHFFNNKMITIKVGTLATLTNWTLIMYIYSYE